MELPYNLREEELILDEVSNEARKNRTLQYESLNRVNLPEEAWERVMTVALEIFHRRPEGITDDAYYLLACIDTAINLEVG